MTKQETPSNDGVKDERDDAAQAAETATQTNDPASGDLQPQLDAARKEAATYLESWQRERAEFLNYRRRTERESKDAYQNITADVLNNLLPIIDDFERALANVPDDIKNHPWFSGTSLIHRKFMKILDDYHITTIDPVGEPFDPTRHQALGADADTDKESGTVTQTLQKGYAVGERVLRPALVKVAQ